MRATDVRCPRCPDDRAPVLLRVERDGTHVRAFVYHPRRRPLGLRDLTRIVGSDDLWFPTDRVTIASAAAPGEVIATDADGNPRHRAVVRQTLRADMSPVTVRCRSGHELVVTRERVVRELEALA
jgi:hypothetical protein